ncbi:MAG: lathosterol oxidase [Gammaproteobacteria bacterium]|jgi:lathosterol oxidase
MNDSSENINKPRKSVWNYHPELPLSRSPLFVWPFNIVNFLRWYRPVWLGLSEMTCYVAIAVFIWLFLLPAAAMAEMNLYSTANIYLQNLILMLLVAGGLHLYFYTFNCQQDRLKFDPRSLERKHSRFTFNNQVWDNMFWTLASGVVFWTLYEVIILAQFGSGNVAILDGQAQPIWFVLLFLLIPIFSAVHFYLVHRLLHWPPLYRIAHALHHRNASTGPWSGISMHPIEHSIYLTSPFIHLLVPSHPIHVLFHFFFLTLGAATSHTGYEGIIIAGKNRFRLGVFYHQLHHRFFECNYGNRECPIDQWVNSYHDGSAESDALVRQRRKQKFS